MWDALSSENSTLMFLSVVSCRLFSVSVMASDLPLHGSTILIVVGCVALAMARSTVDQFLCCNWQLASHAG